MVLPIFPVDTVMLLLGKPTRIANAIVIECDGSFLGGFGVLILNRRIGPLIGNNATLAKMNIPRQTIFDF